MAKPRLLVIEDDPGLQKQLRWSLDSYEVALAEDRPSAMQQMRRHQPAVVTMDLGLPPDPDGASEGLALLQEILSLAPDTKVIVLSGNRERANALKAIGMGAYDFHQKPPEPELLSLALERAYFLHGVQQEIRRMRQTQADSPLAGIISRDPAMLKICRSIERVAPSSATVLLLGDSGSGKELLARGLHQLGGRRDKRFIAINCAAIPEHLLESELFGYEKGAFTGAQRQTPGKIELAQGGTFFLDEIGDMPLALQAKMLRFLQERVIERVGGRSEIAVDVRVVCATHRNLQSLAQAGQFREDLYYRLSEIVLMVPALRERTGDAVLLANHFRNRFRTSEGRRILGFSPEALAAIESHSWPGNVRELENCVRRAVIMSDGPQIGPADMGLAEGSTPEAPLNLRKVREAAEYQAMIRALALADGNILKAAEHLGVSRPTLYDLMNHHGLK